MDMIAFNPELPVVVVVVVAFKVDYLLQHIFCLSSPVPIWECISALPCDHVCEIKIGLTLLKFSALNSYRMHWFGI